MHSWRENSWIHPFPNSISVMWNINCLIQEIELGSMIPFPMMVIFMLSFCSQIWCTGFHALFKKIDCQSEKKMFHSWKLALSNKIIGLCVPCSFCIIEIWGISFKLSLYIQSYELQMWKNCFVAENLLYLIMLLRYLCLVFMVRNMRH